MAGMQKEIPLNFIFCTLLESRFGWLMIHIREASRSTIPLPGIGLCRFTIWIWWIGFGDEREREEEEWETVHTPLMVYWEFIGYFLGFWGYGIGKLWYMDGQVQCSSELRVELLQYIIRTIDWDHDYLTSTLHFILFSFQICNMISILNLIDPLLMLPHALDCSITCDLIDIQDIHSHSSHQLYISSSSYRTRDSLSSRLYFSLSISSHLVNKNKRIRNPVIHIHVHIHIHIHICRTSSQSANSKFQSQR